MSAIVDAIKKRMESVPDTDINLAYYRKKAVKYVNHEKPVCELDVASEDAMLKAFRFVSLPYDKANGIVHK